ncbi:MAG: IclR family transcriptional regulator [Acidobacteriales bacterium]|nr:IclR family transcriptional regulator [Terriglobales bacterium]
MKQHSAFLETEPSTNGPESRALVKGLKILEILAAAKDPLSLAHLAAAIELGKPSTLRLVRTLNALRMTRRVEGDRYLLAIPWPVTHSHFLLQLLRLAASAPMRQLSADWGETVALAYMFDDHIRVVEVLESSHHIRMSNYRDRILQPYASSLGKAIAAFQTCAQAQRLLDVYGIYRLTPNTITALTAISEEFERVRKRGYAEDREETVAGGICVGAPIYSGEEVVASISVSTPRTRFTERYEEELPNQVVATAARISEELRHLASAAA